MEPLGHSPWVRRKFDVLVALWMVGLPAAGWGEPVDVAPAYSRKGVDFYSAPVERPSIRLNPNACEVEYGPDVDVRPDPDREGAYRCVVMTPSEPRLSARLDEEIDMVEERGVWRHRMVKALIEKYRKLAQCPSGTRAVHDGSIFLCERSYQAAEVCPEGVPTANGRSSLSCRMTSCPKGTTDLGALTRGKEPGCYRCPRGTLDLKETEAFHGSLNGLLASYSEVFCSAPSRASSTPAR